MNMLAMNAATLPHIDAWVVLLLLSGAALVPAILAVLTEGGPEAIASRVVDLWKRVRR